MLVEKIVRVRVVTMVDKAVVVVDFMLTPTVAVVRRVKTRVTRMGLVTVDVLVALSMSVLVSVSTRRDVIERVEAAQLVILVV